jgi:hypothetical protein
MRLRAPLHALGFFCYRSICCLLVFLPTRVRRHFCSGLIQTKSRQTVGMVGGHRNNSPFQRQAQMSKRLLRKSAPGGCFPRIDRSPNATDEGDTGSLPQPPRTKRTRASKGQSVLSGLPEPLPRSPLPIPFHFPRSSPRLRVLPGPQSSRPKSPAKTPR